MTELVNVVPYLFSKLGWKCLHDSKPTDARSVELIEQIQLVLTELGLHGGVWDKNLTQMLAVCGLLREEKLLSTVLAGTRFRVFWFVQG